MSSLDFIAHLSKYLFWDADRNDIDIEKHSVYIIQRVMEFGELNDWKFIRDYYGINRIVEDCKKMRTLDPKALSFICAISGTKKEDYRCYTMRQYTQKHWSY